MEVSGKLNERLGAHQGVFQEYSARGASRATTLFTVLVLVSKGNRAAILGRPPRWLYSNREERRQQRKTTKHQWSGPLHSQGGLYGGART